MSKRVEKQLNSFKYKGEPIKITIGTLVLTCLCILFLIVATFTQVTLTHPNVWMEAFSSLQEGFEPAHDLIRTYRYIPQIPMVFLLLHFLEENSEYYQYSGILFWVCFSRFLLWAAG